VIFWDLLTSLDWKQQNLRFKFRYSLDVYEFIGCCFFKYILIFPFFETFQHQFNDQKVVFNHPKHGENRTQVVPPPQDAAPSARLWAHHRVAPLPGALRGARSARSTRCHWQKRQVVSRGTGTGVSRKMDLQAVLIRIASGFRGNVIGVDVEIERSAWKAAGKRVQFQVCKIV